ncbi:L-2-amino-thiazoline-4-carboxylic acid hydrolase [Clostridium felsineum]|uniref:L-2-amino-thiazoline-4-carboxylic acid hydrolase n=1 Tax=Clostridium felsineum TaxID=36839 RepID=UPI00098CD05C|nr:L-2-amino-thiazoline-4-carboxylic acid hydrolase [Clostridium felsineum]MCR3758921.1 L-2-amino-thiazoline-4-carboxylic acid hydrolase [Clostridium felsineum]URZ14071.1 hypothetical protein CLFE_000460 [Clostridium felsineum DSM 794]
MHMTISAYLFPILSRKIVLEQLSSYYPKNDLKKLIKHINKEYIAIVKRASDIGGNKNIFSGSYLISMYLIAAYKNTTKKISIDEWNKLIKNILINSDFIKKRISKSNQLSKSYKNKIIEASKWCRENEAKYPDNWQVELKDSENPNLTHKVFTKCGLCILCKKEGIPEFTPCLCATDYITVGFSNCKLYRPTTLAKGDSCCDFYITPL